MTETAKCERAVVRKAIVASTVVRPALVPRCLPSSASTDRMFHVFSCNLYHSNLSNHRGNRAPPDPTDPTTADSA